MSNKQSVKNAAAIRGVAFKEIEHTADRALRIYGSDLQELLQNLSNLPSPDNKIRLDRAILFEQ